MPRSKTETHILDYLETCKGNRDTLANIASAIDRPVDVTLRLVTLIEDAGDCLVAQIGASRRDWLVTSIRPMPDSPPRSCSTSSLGRPSTFCSICGDSEEPGESGSTSRKLHIRLIRLNEKTFHDACERCLNALKRGNDVQFVSIHADNSRAYYDHPVMNEHEVIDTMEEWLVDLDNGEFFVNDERLEWLKTAIPFVLAKMKTPSQNE